MHDDLKNANVRHYAYLKEQAITRDGMNSQKTTTVCLSTMANAPRQLTRGDGASPESAIEEQNCDTGGFSTYGFNKVGESNTATEAITFHNNHEFLNPLQYLADEDSAFGLGSTLPTLYDLSGDAYLSPSQQEARQAHSMPYATPSSEHSYSDAGSSALRGSIDTLKDPNQAGNHEKSQEAHDCEAFALSVLRSLHYLPLYATNKYRQNTSGIQAAALSETYSGTITDGPEVIPSLDTILRANRSALSGVVTLLECSCARKPHLATLYMSIITRILSLYELAASTDISLLSPSNSTAPTSPTHNLSQAHLARTAIIQVGVFDLDEEDQATLQRGILLRQLRNMERAIEKFASLGIGDANDHDTSVRQWHSVSVSMIKKELQRIYHNCKERLLIIA
ncbi:MAG: hypothetical protein Q9202_002594 [Teloschistes flavicans]